MYTPQLIVIAIAAGRWYNVALKDDGNILEYTFDTTAERTGVTSLLRKMSEIGVQFRDLDTKTSSLEEIFVNLVHGKA